MNPNDIKIIFGGGAFIEGSVEDVTSWLDTLESAGVSNIDTAQAYGQSETLLGKAGAASRFNLDTKVSSGVGPDRATADFVLKSGQESLKKLQTDSVDVYYLHAPDRRVPWKETLTGLDALYKQGAFKRLGLSNFRGKEVEEVIKVAKENNLVIPSVYQGNYSAVARRIEKEVFPVLRKHNMAFYAYSPIAGGFLARSKAMLTEGRFGKDDAMGQTYNAMYNKPSFLAALDAWEQIAESERATRAELAFRWVMYHSKLQSTYGDAIIVGASKEKQLKDTVEFLRKGPLSDSAVEKIDAIWDSIEKDAFLDNLEGVAIVQKESR
ncbi:aflatoxin B1 aldehyde reductase [Microdochium nivale]|nr:aflatoxin B1 aldehyde reductase [Microdochium nivale]